jgi:hypothetical protein
MTTWNIVRGVGMALGSPNENCACGVVRMHQISCFPKSRRTTPDPCRSGVEAPHSCAHTWCSGPIGEAQQVARGVGSPPADPLRQTIHRPSAWDGWSERMPGDQPYDGYLYSARTGTMAAIRTALCRWLDAHGHRSAECAPPRAAAKTASLQIRPPLCVPAPQEKAAYNYRCGADLPPPILSLERPPAYLSVAEDKGEQEARDLADLFSGHSMRAGYATTVGEHDVPGYCIQQRMRHQSMDTTPRLPSTPSPRPPARSRQPSLCFPGPPPRFRASRSAASSIVVPKKRTWFT